MSRHLVPSVRLASQAYLGPSQGLISRLSSSVLLISQRQNSTSTSPPSPSAAPSPAQTQVQAQAQGQAAATAQRPATSDTAERNDRRRHGYFYRDILPPFLRVLAYGSAAYFALHLAWQYLDGREQKQLEEEVRRELEEEVRLRVEAQKEREQKRAKGWFSWFGGGAAATK